MDERLEFTSRVREAARIVGEDLLAPVVNFRLKNRSDYNDYANFSHISGRFEYQCCMIMGNVTDMVGVPFVTTIMIGLGTQSALLGGIAGVLAYIGEGHLINRFRTSEEVVLEDVLKEVDQIFENPHNS